MSSFHFKTVDFGTRIPVNLRNTFVLKKDDWNDFGSQIRYDLFYFDGSGLRSQYGKVKLLSRIPYAATQLVERITQLPPNFDKLDKSYISLGQSQHYYEQLGMDFGAAGAIPILEALRDIAVMPGIVSDFETSPPFRNGMMRENAAQRARRFGRSWVRGDEVHIKPRFCYASEIGGGAIATTACFDFADEDDLPSRIVAIIGRNAVGKTIFLSRLAADLAQIERISEERKTRKLEQFPDGRPEFARVIAVSYSAFDRFRRPEVTPYSSYVYCGIRDERGNMSQRALATSYNRNRNRIREHGRENEWIRYILAILGDTEGLTQEKLRTELADEDSSDLFNELSSGQAILCHFITSVLAWIEQESIILFDEPETHLHPNAVANLFLSLTNILESYESYAVVATHSPVVLQEVPSSRVQHFVRNGDTTIAETLGVESFGESVTELTRHVFKTFEVDSLYKDVLKKLARSLEPEQVLALFPHGLGLAAQAYLLGQYEAARDR